MDTRTAAVSLRNVTKTFGAVVANEKVNLDIYKGEILALLGENGSGKTTLMNMLSGIYFPDEGQIFINGKEEIIKSPKDALKLGIGMVHQHFKLVDVLSATENIVLGLEGKLNIKEASGKIAHICEKYGFEVDPKQKIYDMSVSQKQTVEIVKVLYRGADILILDEPVDGLDPVMRRQIWSIILSEVAEKEMTVLVSSHNLRELEDVCDHVGIMHHGKIMIERSLSDLQGSVSKIQVACQSGMPKLPEHFQVLHMANTGRVYTMIVKGDPKEAEAALSYCNPTIVDVLPLTLEEIFIYEMGGADYEVKDILF